LNICQGSIVDFQPTSEPSAIVNAANPPCLGGGGVDGAISHAGGPLLHHDRLGLPIVGRDRNPPIRCPTGSAVVTGPATYGSLHVPYVIHAVGPDYRTWDRKQWNQADELLQSAYRSCLHLAKEKKISCMAFSLLSAGIYRGKKSLKQVLELGVVSVVHWEGYDELKDIFICAFLQEEVDVLLEITQSLEDEGVLQSIPNS
jgi:O-acetyl-ADP-ribose deacetylase (regulator of RNase III)